MNITEDEAKIIQAVLPFTPIKGMWGSEVKSLAKNLESLEERLKDFLEAVNQSPTPVPEDPATQEEATGQE